MDAARETPFFAVWPSSRGRLRPYIESGTRNFGKLVGRMMFRWIMGHRGARRQSSVAPADESSFLSDVAGLTEGSDGARAAEAPPQCSAAESTGARNAEGRQSTAAAAPGVMYEAFYGLKERPFTTVPDPQFLYWSEAHQLAFAILHYGVMTRAPITVITGDIGAGKTTLLRRLLNEIPEELTVGLVSNMKEGRGELLHWVMMALGQEFQADEPYVALFKRFQDFLVDAY
ncbi:MAG TPA: AAA family ATPase, partial [Pararhizobium sp.]|nr:AAA family ATPase [Pararhizobium sp.]